MQRKKIIGISIEKDRVTFCQRTRTAISKKHNISSHLYNKNADLIQIIKDYRRTMDHIKAHIAIGIDHTFYRQTTLTLPNQLKQKEIDRYLDHSLSQHIPQADQHRFTYTYYNFNKKCHITLYYCPNLVIEQIHSMVHQHHWKAISLTPAPARLHTLSQPSTHKPLCIILNQNKTETFYFFYRRHLVASDTISSTRTNIPHPIAIFFSEQPTGSQLQIISQNKTNTLKTHLDNKIKIKFSLLKEKHIECNHNELIALSLIRRARHVR